MSQFLNSLEILKEVNMSESNMMPVDYLLKFYSVETMSELKHVLLEEKIEDVDDIELVALDVLRVSAYTFSYTE